MDKRVIIGVAATIVLAACGSGDDDAVPADTAEQTVAESSQESSPEASQEASQESSQESSDAAVDEATGRDDDELIEIDSLSDAPPECMDLFVDFLREIEPFVEDVDWQQATLQDMDEFGTDFETLGADFEEDSRRLGCDQFTFENDEGFEEMIAIADQEAPGTVGFFEFIRTFTEAGTIDGESAADLPATCDEAVAEIEAAIDEYGQMNQVPAGELARVAQLTGGITTLCNAEELDTIFQREDIAAFFDS